jgi:hypothetical protein
MSTHSQRPSTGKSTEAVSISQALEFARRTNLINMDVTIGTLLEQASGIDPVATPFWHALFASEWVLVTRAMQPISEFQDILEDRGEVKRP